jgi:hypothetical protein
VRGPARLRVRLGADAGVLDAASRELASHATADENQCCGYFPALAGRPGILDDLPACRQCAALFPTLTIAGLHLRFSFIRMSLRQQATVPAYHLDTDAATALTGDPATLRDRLVWRALLNLSSASDRVLHYLDLDPAETALDLDGAYASLSDRRAANGHERHITIPRAREGLIHGIHFVANRVLHSGVDDERGHFVAAYGSETWLEAIGRDASRTVPGV